MVEAAWRLREAKARLEANDAAGALELLLRGTWPPDLEAAALLLEARCFVRRRSALRARRTLERVCAHPAAHPRAVQEAAFYLAQLDAHPEPTCAEARDAFDSRG